MTKNTLRLHFGLRSRAPKQVSDVSPVKWGIVALERAIWRGFTWTELLIPCAVLLGVGAVAYAVGALLFARAPT